MVAELFVTGDRVPDSWCLDTECFGLEDDNDNNNNNNNNNNTRIMFMVLSS